MVEYEFIHYRPAALSSDVHEINHTDGYFEGCPSVSNDGIESQYIIDMHARLQTQLRLPLNGKDLISLRKLHKLPGFLRTKSEIKNALKTHQCSSACSDRTNLKRKSDDVENVNMSFEWPMIIDNNMKNEIMKDYVDSTSAKALAVAECSFCGCSSNVSSIKTYSMDDLNIDVLEDAKLYLRLKLQSESIEVAKPIGNTYNVCTNCRTCVKQKRFFRIPLYSYANGCWIGAVPEELQDLTLLEEMCIARARTTRCTIKLSPGKFSQYATHGNVCIFPQEPRKLHNVLPPPIDTIFDEIAVIFVSSNETMVTEEMLTKSPLLVRRGKVLRALSWLKLNNRFYQQTDISLENLSQYPENGAPPNCPIQYILDSAAEGGGYTTYNTEANSALIGLSDASVTQACCVLDTDRQESTYNLRKVEMIKEILNKRPFLKYPTQNSEPLKTSYNPSLYALLWPTLFPYGTGLFEDEIRTHKSAGMRLLDLKRHVKHVLNMLDPRFQMHITFSFVMMNIIQRKISSYKSKLILKRSWFPKVVEAMQNIDVDSLDDIKAKFISKSPLGETVTESSVKNLLKYVDYISEDVSGSIAEVHRMRYEIRSIMRSIGLPHLFITINPADTYNPIMQVFGGRDINLDEFFHNLTPHHEDFERMKCSVSNPAAAARAFNKVITSFVNVILGMARPNHVGVFGPIRTYYGVVEAQGRGSLHCHFFVWLKGAMNPFEVIDRLRSDEGWKIHFFKWLESIIKHDLPENTNEYLPLLYSKEPLMCRPPLVKEHDLLNERAQDLRNVLQLTGQIHKHSETCYKHLPFLIRSQRDDDADCRFGLPREIVSETYLDDDGHVHLRCENGFVNSYNDLIVSCLRCNMDCKFIGSGTAALAMTEYVTNYIAKISLDSSVIFSCLCAALKSIKNLDSSSNTVRDDMDNRARLLLLKICNGMIGKRELSGQQVMSFLQNIPNRYTNVKFETVWWTSVLKYVSASTFNMDTKDGEQYIILKESDLSMSSLKEDNLPTVVLDYLYRPSELSTTCLWDFWCNFKTVKYRNNNTAEDDGDSTSNEKGDSGNLYYFTDEHPNSLSYMIVKRKSTITPVLSGIQVPRNDGDTDLNRYYIAMLALFKPWNPPPALLKDESCTWKSSFEEMFQSLSYEHHCLLENFQSIHSCKDAAHDFSSARRKRLKTMVSQLTESRSYGREHDSYQLKDDINWVSAMQSVETDEYDFEHDSVLSPRVSGSLKDGIGCAEDGGFYEVTSIIHTSEDLVTEGSDLDIRIADDEFKRLQTLKEHLQKRAQPISNIPSTSQLTSRDDEPIQISFNLQDPPSTILHENLWTSLLPHRKLCIHIIDKFTLNDEQALTFLLFTDHYGLQFCITPPVFKDPLRLIISGPGGTGKSQIFHAIRCFFDHIGHTNRLKVTAPTGLVANNINGTTVHSEASLRLKSIARESFARYIKEGPNFT